MLVIDGAFLEGGGQIVRASVALSALTGTPVRVERIRAGREQPGLRPQHLTAVLAVAAACNAEVSGCARGSRELTFLPGPPSRNEIVLDVGTAGSIPLVIQAWLPVAIRVGGKITLTGGTEVARSPTIDYLARLLIPLLEMHGARVSLEIRRRGYYPKGGGIVRVEAEPSMLQPINPDRRRQEAHRGVCSCSAGLPSHVAERQARAAASLLSRHTGLSFPEELDARPGPGTGSSCTVWMDWMGGIGIGRRGYPAEKVGEEAALILMDEMNGGGMVDSFLADQLLIYLACAGGSYTARTCSLHARTMCWLLEQFGWPVEVSGEGVTRFVRAAGT
jgi:RNA 3'-terminal phosphate cyclase (ATP)